MARTERRAITTEQVTAAETGETWPLAGWIAVVEDVWGSAFDDLARRTRIDYRPEAWQDPAELEELVSGARALVVRNRTSVDAALLDAGRSLAIVARAGVGLDNIDLAAADERGIVVSAALGANSRSVAEHAMALALALARDVAGHDRRTRSGAWERRLGTELAGLTWGALGLGSTGAATIALASAVGMRTAGFDAYLPEAAEVAGLDRRVSSIDELLAEADVLSLHLPLDDATAGIVGPGFLAAMRPGAMLVNVARGGLVDEAALLAALDSGQLAGAALDVRGDEPPLAGDLERHDRVVLTPHVAGLTAAAQERVTAMLAADLAAVLGGGEASYSVGTLRMPRH